MIYIRQEFETRKEAEDFMSAYLCSYHPCGYGTFLSIHEKDGKFVVSGSRQSSCD